MATPNDTILRISQFSGGVTVSWSGGFPPYQLQKCTRIGDTWNDLGVPTMAVSANVETTGTEGYFRVQQSVPLLNVDLSSLDTKLIWSVPELDFSSYLYPPVIPS